MAIITAPTFTPRRRAAQFTQPSQVNRSGWTGKTWVQPSGRGWWSFALEYPPMAEADARLMRAFLARLQGAANSFRLPVVDSPQIASTPTVRVNGAGQTGYSLAVDGMPVSATLLGQGSYITVNDQLLILTADLVANGSGAGTATFASAIRSSPADNTIIEVRTPTCLVSLDGDSVSWEPVEAGMTEAVAFNVREYY